MRDWDKTIDELRKNIDNARKKWVLPYLDTSNLKPNTSENKSKASEEEKNISQNKVLDPKKSNIDEDQLSSSNKTVEASPAEVKEENVEEVPKVDASQVDQK